MEYLWLCMSAVAAGAVNAVAGGGTLLTFPALTSVVAVHIANGTSTVALFPGSFASVWGYRQKLAACQRWIVWLTPPSIVGGGIGAWLVEENTFGFVIPWLIFAAALLFTLQPTIARWLSPPPSHDAPTDDNAVPTDAPAAPISGKTLAGIVAAQFLIGVYGGYFGAGIGILMLSSLSFLGLKDIHEVNALKSFLAFCMNIVAAGVFIANNLVHWQYAAAMALAAIVGGYLGARFSLLLPTAIVRWIVIVLGFSLAAYYFARPFLLG
ncbi:MAG: sulfite exporter TauE/SafE family protein [Planctomycetes bacterium]|nr:sulfite exporter TauE/SafE family protein [Planctomycetota bacterium]